MGKSDIKTCHFMRYYRLRKQAIYGSKVHDLPGHGQGWFASARSYGNNFTSNKKAKLLPNLTTIVVPSSSKKEMAQ